MQNEITDQTIRDFARALVALGMSIKSDPEVYAAYQAAVAEKKAKQAEENRREGKQTVGVQTY